jgi:hypothetical protein
MKKILPFLIILISCSTKPTDEEHAEYLSRFEPIIEKQRLCHWTEINTLENTFLNSVKDSSERIYLDEKTLYFRKANVRFIYSIDSVAYQLMIAVDNIPEKYSHIMDTVNPTYSRNFNESEKSLALLKGGLNDRIINRIKSWEKLITDSIPIKVNLSSFWANEYVNIKNMGDFQIARYKLYYQSDSFTCNIIKYLDNQYKTKSKSADTKL